MYFALVEPEGFVLFLNAHSFTTTEARLIQFTGLRIT